MSRARLSAVCFRLTLGSCALLGACGPSTNSVKPPDGGGVLPDAGGPDGGGPADLAMPSFGTGGTWSFDEGAGTTASGAALRGAPAWTVGKVNTALDLDGKADSVATAAPALDPTQTLSADAWVRLSRLDAAATIVSLNGHTTSAFWLGYQPPSPTQPGRFAATWASADVDAAPTTSVAAPFGPVADVWYHVAAVFDPATHQARLYVDGNKAAQATVSGLFAGAAPTTLGCGVAAGAPARFWPGALDEVRLAAVAWSDADVAATYHAARAITPVRPPAVPLLVRGPYVSTWMPADNAPGTWPTFWTGAVKAITGFLRVDGKPYTFFGNPSGGAPTAQQLQLEVTATQSRYVFAAGGVHAYVDFLSPVDADDIRRLATPYGYISIQAVSVDGQAHATSVYLDISGEWAHGDATTLIGWNRADIPASPQTLSAFAISPSSPGVLQESGDYASWGTAIFATATPGVGWQAGADTTVRGAFLGGGALANTLDGTQPRAINNNWPVFAYQADLGMLAGTPSSPRWFVVGNVRQPAVSYLGTPMPPLWQAYWSSWQAMLADGVADASAGGLVARADALDAKIAHAAVARGGAHYAGLCALALRQAFGGVELVNTGNDPWLFLKEISSDGNLSTVDVIYPSMPALLYVNPLLVRYLLTPLLVYSESGKWPQAYAPHDLGASYPNASGHNDGGGENMPVEESANMVLMAAAYLGAAQNADARTFLSSHYALLKAWADYLVGNALDPGLQNQTDDFTGFIAHSSNLALKGILAIGAMGQISKALGNSADGDHYTSTAQSYIAQWAMKSQNGTQSHLKLAYDATDDTWSLKYNSYPDRLLRLGLIPAATLGEESSWYSHQKANYGFPLDNRHTYTKADWELWTAAGVGDLALRQALVDGLFQFADQTVSRVPFTDWYDTQAGTQNGFQARPVMGGLFSLLTIP
jgi:hypothetical protein